MRLQYTVNFKRAAEDIEQKVQYAGNSTKALRLSVDASLKKLRTEYIDILYLHMVSLDPSRRCGNNLNSPCEVELGHLRRGGDEQLAQPSRLWESSVLGTLRPTHCVRQRSSWSQGISDTPAWIVSKANLYARMTGKTPFVVYQGSWNVMQRDFERDIIPLARMEGMALAPWGVLAGGRIRTDEEELKRRQTGENGAYLTASAQLPMLAH